MRKKPVYILLITLCLFYIAFPIDAQEQALQVELSLQDCISLALKSNLSIRIQRIGPQIQDSFLLMEKGRFDPLLSLDANSERSDVLSSTQTDTQRSNSQSLRLGISDPIVTGGSYGIYLNSNRSDSSGSLNPSYRSGTAFSVSQPLLEGFGIGTNKAGIRIANNNKDISLLTLKAQLINNLSDVQNTYWELVFAIENLKVQELSLKQAQDLLSINQRFKESGKASVSDILQAQAAVASREADVIAAKDAVKDAEDRLKRITNIIQDESQWEMTIIPLDTPSFSEIQVNLNESIAEAIEKRPEYAQAKLDVENSELSIKLARNQRLPIVDLEGSLTLNGLGDEIGDSFSQIGDAENKTWWAGIALRMPFGGRTDKGNLKKSQLEKERKLLILKEVEQQIIADVRSAVRQIDTDKMRIEATSKAEDFARQVLSAEEKKYALELSTSYDLLQFQASLATATKNHLRAVVDYHKSVVSLYQSLGITIEKLNIELER